MIEDRPSTIAWLLAWMFCVGFCAMFWALAYRVYEVMR